MQNSLETRLIERRKRSKPLRLDNVLLSISLASINKADAEVAQEIETWVYRFVLSEKFPKVLVNYIKFSRFRERLI